MPDTANPAAQILDLGVPVRSLNWVRLFPGRNAAGEPLLLASMGQDAGGLFVCDIDLGTGHCTQFPVNLPHASFPTAAYQNPATGVLYVGSAYTGHLHRYDPNVPAGERRLEDLGAIDPELASFPCRIDEAPDGSIWIGAYGGCSLTQFDPQSRQFRRFGRMDETDQYFYPLCGSDGTVAGLVRVCRVHVVLIDPASGRHRCVGPVINTNAVGESTQAKPQLDLIKGTDGLLYVTSSEGNLRLCGMEAIAVEHVPPAMAAAGLPDGAAAEIIDSEAQIYRRLSVAARGGQTRMLDLDWQGNGTHIFVIHQGPEGRIYGSSALPEHLFVCDENESNMRDLGQCSLARGEAYSMGNLGGLLYIASYPEARLSIYDPGRPYRFGTDEHANPRDIGRLDHVAYRPRAMVCGPAGKVWVASIPDYGMWGGTLAWYDPATGAIGSHRHLIPECSPTALAWLPEMGLILVGLGRHGGSGTQPRAATGGFVLWDPKRDTAVWSGDFGLGAIESVLSLCRAPDGSVYAIVELNRPEPAPSKHPISAELIRLDLAGRRLLDRSLFSSTEGWPTAVSLTPGPDAAVYGSLLTQFYRIVPSTCRREVVWSATWGDEANYIPTPGPIIGRRFYCASGHRLRAIDF